MHNARAIGAGILFFHRVMWNAETIIHNGARKSDHS